MALVHRWPPSLEIKLRNDKVDDDLPKAAERAACGNQSLFMLFHVPPCFMFKLTRECGSGFLFVSLPTRLPVFVVARRTVRIYVHSRLALTTRMQTKLLMTRMVFSCFGMDLAVLVCTAKSVPVSDYL